MRTTLLLHLPLRLNHLNPPRPCLNLQSSIDIRDDAILPLIRRLQEVHHQLAMLVRLDCVPPCDIL